MNRYNLIQIDMNSEYQNTDDKGRLLSKLKKKIKKEMVREFPNIEFDEEDSLAECILNVYSETKETFVILIDEYDHTKDDVFTYLTHLGYLTYDRDGNTGYGTCRIPNKEVRQEWFNAIETEEEYAVTTRIIQDSRKLLYDTWTGNAEAVEQALDLTHIHVTSNRSYNNKDALQSAIYLAYIYALNYYTVIREMTAGKGFADVVYIPFREKAPAMIIELKRNSCPDSALEQIRNRQYYDSLNHYQGKLLFVGINYNEKEKNIVVRLNHL